MCDFTKTDARVDTRWLSSLVTAGRNQTTHVIEFLGLDRVPYVEGERCASEEHLSMASAEALDGKYL